MALEVEWYDFVCFGIVGVALIGALWVLWKKETVSRRQYDSRYESLLVARPDHEVDATSLPKGHVSAAQLWTSSWRGLNPLWLLSTRFTSFLVMAVLLTWDALKNGSAIFYYYSEWTFTLVMIYFALASVVSAYGCWHNLKPSEHGAEADYLRRDLEESMSSDTVTYEEKETRGSIKLQSLYAGEEFQQRAGFWGYLMQIIYQICGGAVIITDIVYWGVIVPFLTISRLKLNSLMGFMHTLNLAFLLVDTALNDLPFPWFRMAYFVLWSCAYIIFLWVAHVCGLSWWPYPFLELDNPWAPLWYFFLAAFHIPCYWLYVLIVKAKDWESLLQFQPTTLTQIPALSERGS
ncbi:uncharacterized protein LOC114728293 [Neltuma alba]|uniref:uncharacterized protein LOC114728293 n=1 Tax=Neltuma alba TaxID=207710 RepID=UPI0010A2EB26|nr:uncharacterized protein LOC114728293 [Prosopis alba]